MALEPADRDSPDLFHALLAAAEQYMTTLGLSDLCRMDKKSGVSEHLELEDVTAFIQVSGAIQGGFLFTADHHLSRKLAKYFIVEEISEAEAGQYAVEVVAEVANIVSAHSLSEREETDLFLGHPIMILSRDMGLQASTYQEQTYSASGGYCRWLYIPKMDKTELASIVILRKQTS